MNQALLLFILGLFAAQAKATILMVDAPEGPQVNRPLPCDAQVASVCSQKQALRSERLLFGGIVNKITCLTDKQQHISDECFINEISVSMDEMIEKQGSKCKDELRSKCGKQIDALKKAIQDTSVIGTIKGAVDVVECVVSHAEDLWEHCKPQKHMAPMPVDVTITESCSVRAAGLCPPTQHKILGLGFTVGCLSDNIPVLGMDCAKEQMLIALNDAENSDDKSCHDELRKKCGKQIDQLKKEIQDTSILGIIKGAVDVVQCVAQNAEDLWQKCNPFDETAKQAQEVAFDDDENAPEIVFAAGAPTPPTKKPTQKPTHRPTKKPTHEPTHKPTQKPTKASPTTKPTTKSPSIHKIMEAMTNVQMMEEPEVEGSMDALMPMHMDTLEDVDDVEAQTVVESSVEIDMDACVRTARRLCSAQVEAFNASPFDRSLLQALNDCIESRATEIESECVTSSTRTMSIFPKWFGGHHHGHHGPHGKSMMMEPHPPCRHPEDMNSNLPVCDPTHRCPHRHHHFWLGFGIVVFLFAAIKTVRVCKRRRECCKAKKAAAQVASERTVDGLSYQQIKSDNAAPVPANNIV